MKLIRLETTNFKKLKQNVINFTDGLNTVIGENAQGKSTTLQAVMVALYGISTAPGKKENLPTWGTSKFEIRLEFEHRGQEFKVTRNLTSAKIESVDEVKASGHSACTKFVTELLGMDYKELCMFVLSSQGETAGVLTFGATELQRRVEAFSGADVIDKVMTRARKELNILEASIKGIEWVDLNPIHDRECGHNVAIGEAEKKLAEVEDTKRKRQACYNDAKRSIERIQTELQIVKTFHGRRDKVEADEQALQASLDTLGEAPKFEEINIDAKLDERDEINDNYQSLLASKTSYFALEKQIKQLETETNELAKEAHEEELTAQQILILEPEIETARAEYAKTNAEYETVTNTISEIRRILDSGICPECNRPLDDFEPQEYEAKLNAAVSRSEELADQLEKIKGVGESKAKRLKLLKSQIKGAARSLEDKENSLVSLTADFEAMAKPDDSAIQCCELAIQSLTEEIADYKNSKALFDDYRYKRNQLNEKSEEIAVAKAELEKIEAELPKATDSSLKLMSDSLTSIGEEITKLTETAAEIESTIREVIAARDEDSRLFKAATESNKRIKETSAQIDLHKQLIKFLGESRSKYLGQVWEQILGIASHHLTVSTKGWLTRISRTEDGSFQFEDEGKWTPVQSASGAQKGFLGVALRIGLTSALYGDTGLMILDEPTEAMSDSKAQSLAGSLMGLSGQCLLVTHRKLEQLSAQNVIEIGNKQ